MFGSSASSHILATLLLTVPHVKAAFPNRKFEQWYEAYQPQFSEASTNDCNATLKMYLEDHVPATNNRIAAHADCILAHTSETIKANMGSVGVILGLTPSLLSFMGPTVTELSMLTLERPLLSGLLALAGPATWPARGFEHHSPLQATRTLPRVPSAIRSVWWVRYAVSAIEYLVAVGAAMNVVTLCLELGWKTMVTWKKTDSYMTLGWVTLALTVHVFGAIRLQFAKTATSEKALESSHGNSAKRYCLSANELLVRETQLCCFRRTQDYTSLQEDQETFFWYHFGLALSTVCIIHQIFGVVVFSSLLFIGAKDTILVITRLAVSATLAQYIRAFEISGLLIGVPEPCQDFGFTLNPCRKSGQTGQSVKSKESYVPVRRSESS